MSDKGSVTSLPSIRQYLLLRMVGVVAVSFIVFSSAAYLFVVRPAQDELARVEMSRAAEEVEGRMRQLIGESEQQLALLYAWVQSGLIGVNSTQEVARLLIPTLRQQPQGSVIAVADERGRTPRFGAEPVGRRR